MKPSDLYLFLLLPFLLCSCRSGHFEGKKFEETSEAPAKISPAEKPDEDLLASPISVTTIGQTEKSIQSWEYTVEHLVALSSHEAASIRNRKISYKISFLNSSLPPVENEAMSDEKGELRLIFSLPFRPYDHEINFSVQITAKFSDKTDGPSPTWNLLLNFDHDPVNPLLSTSVPAETKKLTEAQEAKLKNLIFTETLSDERLAIDSSFNAEFIPKVSLQGVVALSRSRIGRTEAEWKPLSKIKLRGKIFLLGAGLKNPLSEQAFETVSNRSGEIFLDLQTRPIPLPLSATAGIWVVAFELPDFSKIEKAFIAYDLRTSKTEPWSKAKALEFIGGSVYDLTVSKPAPSRKLPEEISVKDFFRNSVHIPEPSFNFEESLVLASQNESWPSFLESLSPSLGFNGTNKREVKQIDFVQKISSSELLDKRKFSASVILSNQLEVRAQLVQNLVKVLGNSQRCFAFVGTGEYYYCLSKIGIFETTETWTAIFPEEGEFGFSPFIIRGALDFSRPLLIPKKDVSTSKAAVLVRKIFPAP